jgi:hypothetical protein
MAAYSFVELELGPTHAINLLARLSAKGKPIDFWLKQRLPEPAAGRIP